jgi:Flp pilus assembly pilin Flp
LELLNSTKYVRSVSSFQRCTKGSTGIEYAMVAALVSLAFLTALTALGQNISVTLAHVAAAMEGTPDTIPDFGGGQ